MSKKIFVNLPVTDLSKSTQFYTALGFSKNADFSDDKACAMMWSDEIVVMLLKHEFYKKFIRDKVISDATKTNTVLLALTLDSKEEVQKFADIAKQNGGDHYKVEYGAPEDMMFGYEVVDPDGHQWEPVWMNPKFIPEGPNKTV